MATFFRIISFPLRLIILIAAFILRAVLYILGTFICFVSEVAGVFLAIFGVLLNGIAVFGTILYIKEIKAGNVALTQGILYIALLWVIAFIVDGIWLLGYSIGEFLQDLGGNITDVALELMSI